MNDGNRDSDRPIIDNLAAVWASIDGLCMDLTAQEWEQPTDCPGWSVKDHLSHLVGSESLFLGRPLPDHTPPRAGHLANPLAEMNEVAVDYRRSWPGERVLEEFREVGAARLAQLRVLTPEDFARDSWMPVGKGTLRDLLRTRVFDCWVHEQDMRRALGSPGGMEGAPAQQAMAMIAAAIPRTVAKQAAPPDGATIVLDITGPMRDILSIAIAGKRANLLADVPARPTVRLTANFETFMRLAVGRCDPQTVLRENRVVIEGDGSLGRRVVEHLNFLF